MLMRQYSGKRVIITTARAKRVCGIDSIHCATRKTCRHCPCSRKCALPIDDQLIPDTSDTCLRVHTSRRRNPFLRRLTDHAFSVTIVLDDNRWPLNYHSLAEATTEYTGYYPGLHDGSYSCVKHKAHSNQSSTFVMCKLLQSNKSLRTSIKPPSQQQVFEWLPMPMHFHPASHPPVLRLDLCRRREGNRESRCRCISI